ncbi:prevent-host-death family protein [Arthrobacter silviterrae]|uniref:Antitoxin n=1 Tax=Arthrobacter silviterrae TaxID=2026658 RepID=A0ABX0D5E5_9MICC|nr:MULTISPECIES: type II toxin-antitoxin system Phd/YefM family antitoxin [Arthrobacter]MCU6480113.1 type II toxin-antitoxin system Phd/YefM family antitoxin [Arthrobacter sp. A2-55]MDQ0279412.1 prevent-host-death family protein [Arthrobacter silviterrae]NGN82108.1 type II toxin-antitoxin system Phd/YefM family antitoxin [Arthrobacter silviterrae]
MTEISSTMSVAELRAGLSDAISRATFGHERIGITRRGKVAAVLIGPEDLEMLERLEDREDLAALRRARVEDDGERISLDEVLAANGITR